MEHLTGLTEAEIYEKGWFISSEDAKVLFMAKIVECATEVATAWNSLSEYEVDVDRFAAFVRMDYGWLSAHNLQKVSKEDVVGNLANFLNLKMGILNTEADVRYFLEVSNIEFWTGVIDVKLPNSFMNCGESNEVIKEILLKAEL